jgi:hypothetical protein
MIGSDRDGPDEQERLAPGDTSTNPTGASNKTPAKDEKEGGPRRPEPPER